MDCRLLYNLPPPPAPLYPPLCLTPSMSGTSDFSSWVLPSFSHLRTLTLIETSTWNTQPFTPSLLSYFYSKDLPLTSLAPPYLCSLTLPHFPHLTVTWDYSIYWVMFMACHLHNRSTVFVYLVHCWILCIMTVPGTYMLNEQLSSRNLWHLQLPESFIRGNLGFSSSGINY